MFVGHHARRVVVRGPKIMLLDLIWQVLGFKSSNWAQSKGDDPCHLVVHLKRRVVASRLTHVVFRAQTRTDIAPCVCVRRLSAMAKGVPMAPWALVMFFSIVLVSRACGGCVRVASRAVCPTDATSLHLLISSKPHFLPMAGMGAVRACPTLACMPPDFARA